MKYKVFSLFEGAIVGFLLSIPLLLDYHLWVLSLLALTFFFWRTDILSTKKHWFYLYYLGFGLSWLVICSIHTFISFYFIGNGELISSSLSWLYIVVGCLIFHFLSAFLYRRTYLLSPWIRIFIFISVWVFFEWCRVSLSGIYNLFSLSYFYTQGPLSSYAAIGGELFITSIVLLMSLTAALMLRQQLNKKHVLILNLAIVIGGTALLYYNWSEKIENKQINVAMIQTNEDPLTRHDSTESLFNNLIFETKKWLSQINDNVDLVITSEAFVSDFIFNYPPEFFTLLRNWSKTHQADWIISSYDVVPRDINNGYYFYSSAYIENQSLQAKQEGQEEWWHKQQRIYHKKALIPFVEYLPNWATKIGLTHFFPKAEGIVGKSALTLWPVNNKVLVSPSICYDFYHGSAVRTNAIGTDALVNQGYHGWLKNSYGMTIMHKISRMRAIESARPVLRVDGYGISGLIDPKGKDQILIPKDKSLVWHTKLHAYKGSTPYYQYGYWIVFSFLFIGFIIASFASFISIKKKFN